MHFTMASLSCVDGKDHSLPHLLELFPREQGEKVPTLSHLLGEILRLARIFRAYASV